MGTPPCADDRRPDIPLADLFLVRFGPWSWPLQNKNELYTFVCSAHFVLLFGYLSVAHRQPKEPLTIRFDTQRLLKTSLWVTLLLVPFTSYVRTGHWVPDIVEGLADSGKAYLEAHLYSENSTGVASYIRIIASPWLVILFPLAFFMRKELSRGTWILVLVAMTAVILMSIATGQRRDIADLMVTIPFIMMASHWAGKTRLKQTTILSAVGIGLAIVIAFSTYFTLSHVSRVGEKTADYGVNPATRMMPDPNNATLQFLPAEAQPGLVGLISYLSTGYYGLGLSMDRPIKPMYGLGHSMFLTRNFERLANVRSFESQSLAVQISDKDGFKYPGLWCTAYPYFANDLGFFGTLLMLFFLGRGLASTWIDMLGGKNPIAVVLFSLLLTMVFYLPLTNRMLQDGEGVIAFYSWLLIYVSSQFVRRTAPTLQTA